MMSYWICSVNDMKTIDDILQEAAGYNNVLKQIARDDRIERVYEQYPELRDIDSKLMDSRRGRLMAAMDHDQSAEDAYAKREIELTGRREEFIGKNKIDPQFDELKDICATCHDTGYKVNARGTRVVCDCRKRELEESFAEAGMADYSTYTLNKYDKKHGKDPAKRNSVLNNMMNVVLGKDKKTLCLYIDEPGSGKTYLSICMVKAAITMGKSGAFVRCEDIADKEDEIGDYKTCDFLLIDDFAGEVTLRARVSGNLNDILESRIATGRPTVLVSFTDKESLIGESDARIAAKIQRAEVL